MRNLKNVISEYLSKETDYAVQIVGNWGSGKTYYYRNILEPMIKKIGTAVNGSKKYKPIYVSLFGMKSIEEIATKIVFEFYQSKFFKDYRKANKGLKITGSVFSIGLRGFLNFQRLGNLNDYKTDIKGIAESVLDTSELVICLDDLERKDTSFNLMDLTGYINSLSDEGVKVLVITNEDILKEESEYQNLKEKIIGVTIDYVPDIPTTILNIINSRYTGFRGYRTFLLKVTDTLISTTNSSKGNFRHMIYALDVLHVCYSRISTSLIDIKHELAEKIESELENISRFVLAFAIEFKSSNIRYDDLEQLRNDWSNDILDDLLPEVRSNSEETKLDLLREKHGLSKEGYQFYESIFSYVTGRKEFNLESFTDEFSRNFHLSDGNVLPEYTVVRELGYWHCYSLSDEEYKEKTNQLIEFAHSGLYKPSEYLVVMHYVERFDNPLKFDLEHVQAKLISGLSKSIENLQEAYPNEEFQFEISGTNGNISELTKKVFHNGLEAFKLRKEQLEQNELDSIIATFSNSLVEFKELYSTDANIRSKVNETSIINHIGSDALIRIVFQESGENVKLLHTFLNDRYNERSVLLSERGTLMQFENELQRYLQVASNETPFLKGLVIDQLLSFLTKILESEAQDNASID